FTITGISESWDGNIRLNPRVQSDLARIWPEEILVEVSAPAAISIGPIEYQIDITNHTSETQIDLLVTAPRPEGNIESIIVNVGETGVTATREIINWNIPKMEPGQSVRLSLSVSLSESNQSDSSGAHGKIIFFPVQVSSEQTADPVMSEDLAVYTGGILPIWAIQGSGNKSPYVGRTETTSGIITGIFPELDGLFIQSQNDDQNVSTSNGVFVYFDDTTIPESLERGMLINVIGLITERSEQTEIQVTSEEDITIISTTDLLDTILPSPLAPPMQEALAYFEAREGMLVTLDSYAVAVGPTNRFGETPLFPVSLADSLAPGAPLIYREMGTLNESIIFIDDGSFAEYQFGNQLPLALATGDVISSVSGPLAFSFGNYKIEPADLSQITIEPSTYADQQIEAQPERPTNQIAIATFNVENLFDPFEPHPSSPDLPTLDEYNRKITKIEAAISLMGFPEIIALQEVENVDVLEDLVESIKESHNVSYTPHLLEGTDSRGIDVAYLTSEMITVESVTQWPAPEGVTSRDPLMLTATIQNESINRPIVVINNHFTSLAGGEEATLPRRTAQAEWNVGLVKQAMAENPEASVVVLGDLNSFRETDPLETLEEVLTHVYDGPSITENMMVPYTYIFEGVAQSLDHILVSDDLFGNLVDVIALPINAEYPLQDEDDVSPYRSSDHNPLIAIFELE
ncbi:MAG: endonuclease/exonuclease/phosphatase family protein, partial [Chloroflexota bacterium]